MAAYLTNKRSNLVAQLHRAPQETNISCVNDAVATQGIGCFSTTGPYLAAGAATVNALISAAAFPAPPEQPSCVLRCNHPEGSGRGASPACGSKAAYCAQNPAAPARCTRRPASGRAGLGFPGTHARAAPDMGGRAAADAQAATQAGVSSGSPAATASCHLARRLHSRPATTACTGACACAPSEVSLCYWRLHSRPALSACMGACAYTLSGSDFCHWRLPLVRQ